MVRYDEKSLTTPNLATHFTARKLILPSREMLTFSGAKHHINMPILLHFTSELTKGLTVHSSGGIGCLWLPNTRPADQGVAAMEPSIAVLPQNPLT